MKKMICNGDDELQGEGFWLDVVRAYQEFVSEGVKFSTEDALWDAAKCRARFRCKIARWVDRAQKEDKSYADIVAEEIGLEQRQERDRENN